MCLLNNDFKVRLQKVTYLGFVCESDNYRIEEQPKFRQAFPTRIMNIYILNIYTRDVFYVRIEVDLMKTAKVNAYIMHIFGKIELLSIQAT